MRTYPRSGFVPGNIRQKAQNHPFGKPPFSRTKSQPKEEVFGTDIPRTSGGHSRGYPGPKLRSGGSKSWKNKHLGTDIHDPKARTSRTLRDFQKLRSEKLWAEFSFPTFWKVTKEFKKTNDRKGVESLCEKKVCALSGFKKALRGVFCRST